MNKKIFIIEDDINLCSAMTAKFSILGFKVTNYIDQQIPVIVNKIKSFQPNLITLNLFLPSVDSFELLSAIKSDEQLGNVPVFIFSDLNSTKDKERAMVLGADHFFTKSKFTLDEFIDRIKKIILNKDKLIKS